MLSSQEAAASIQEIQRLIAANPAVITDISGSGRTALIEAAVREHREAVALLLDHGAAVDAQDRNSWTALHWAGMQGNADIATLLLAKGANVSALTMHDGCTPVHLAAQQRKPDVLRVLASAGADMNARQMQGGKTPLHVAVEWESVAVAKTLLELGADMFVKDFKGEHPANLAYRLYGTVLYPGHVHAMRRVFIEFQELKKPDELVAGCRALILGLVVAPQHNGKEGVLQRWVEESQRWRGSARRQHTRCRRHTRCRLPVFL